MHHPQNAMLASSCLASRSQEIWLIRLCVTSAAWTSILHCRRSKQASRSKQQFLHDEFVRSAAAHSRRAVMGSQSGAGFWPRFPPPIPHSCWKKKKSVEDKQTHNKLYPHCTCRAIGHDQQTATVSQARRHAGTQEPVLGHDSRPYHGENQDKRMTRSRPRPVRRMKHV